MATLLGHQMSAEVTKLSVPRRFRGWCDECQDGVQGVKQTAIKWAAVHNEEFHREDAS